MDQQSINDDSFSPTKDSKPLPNVFFVSVLTWGNPDAKRLFDDLLSSYNKLVRPVMNVTDAVTVKFKLKLSQLIDVVSVAPWKS